MVNKERIQSAEIFGDLREDELEKVAMICDEEAFDEGEKIFAERDRAESFYILETGRVDLRFELPAQETSKQMTVTSIQKGECFGWSALIPPHKSTLSGYSCGKTRLIRISGEDLNRFFDKEPRAGYVIMKNLATTIGDRLTKQHDIFIKEVGESLQYKW